MPGRTGGEDRRHEHGGEGWAPAGEGNSAEPPPSVDDLKPPASTTGLAGCRLRSTPGLLPGVRQARSSGPEPQPRATTWTKQALQSPVPAASPHSSVPGGKSRSMRDASVL